jgi:hypothetical protein
MGMDERVTCCSAAKHSAAHGSVCMNKPRRSGLAWPCFKLLRCCERSVINRRGGICNSRLTAFLTTSPLAAVGGFGIGCQPARYGQTSDTTVTFYEFKAWHKACIRFSPYR